MHGGCLCGGIRYVLEPPLTDAGYCHCQQCQRANAAPVVAWLTLPVSRFRYVQGQPRVFFSSATYQREFCDTCGTPLALRRRDNPNSIDITIASLDQPTAVAPEYHVWQQSKLDWFDTSDTLPRYRDAGPDTD